MTKNMLGVDTKNIDFYIYSWYNINVRLDAEYTCDRDAQMKGSSNAVESKRTYMSKKRVVEYDYNKFHYIGSLAVIVGVIGLFFADATVPYGFIFCGGLILSLFGQIIGHKEAFDAPLEKRVLLSLKSGHYIAWVLVDRLTGELSAPKHRHDRFTRKADQFDLQSLDTFRAPRYTDHDGKTFTMLGAVYTISDF